MDKVHLQTLIDRAKALPKSEVEKLIIQINRNGKPEPDSFRGQLLQAYESLMH